MPARPNGMRSCRGYRPLAVLAGFTALSLGAGCASAGGSEPVSASGPDSASVSQSTITPIPSVGPPTTTDGTVPKPELGVFGHITDADGPVAGAMLQPAPGPGNAAPEREVFAVSAGDGSYAIGLSPGPWDITVLAAGHEPVVLQVTIPSTGVVEVDTTLDRAGWA